MPHLAFRATVVVRAAQPAENLELIERRFAFDADAIAWCKVMTAGMACATGAWLVALENPGRTLTVVRQTGLQLSDDLVPLEDLALAQSA